MIDADQKSFIQLIQQKDKKMLLSINMFETYADSMKAKRDCEMDLYLHKDLPIEMTLRLLEVATKEIMGRYQQNLNKLQIDKKLKEKGES